MRCLILRVLYFCIAFLSVWIISTGFIIWSFGDKDYTKQSDSIIVLGAAVYGDKPSPVFEERIKHAIGLFQKQSAATMIFTGGLGDGASYTESEVGALYAMHEGISRSAILIETQSRTTLQNLVQAKAIMDSSGLNSAIIVSDPLHLKRASIMASNLGISAVTSPTPTSRYRSLKTKFEFLIREIYFYTQYVVIGK